MWNLKTLGLQLESNIVHPIAYIAGSFRQNQCRWPAITIECCSVFMLIKKISFYLQNADMLVHSGHKPLLKIFTGHMDNDKCKTWGLEDTAIPRHVKVQHIKGVAKVLVDCVSRLRAVGLYHDLVFKDHTQEYSAPFKPLPPFEQMTRTPLDVNEVFIKPNVEKCM